MEVSVLGNVLGNDILLAGTPVRRELPGLLVFSGFHGEEYAAPLGLLQCLGRPEIRQLVARMNIGIVPVTNPSGFDRGSRYNSVNEEDSWAFRFGPGEHPSMEGRVLLRSMDKLLPYATTCFLDMHEDIEAEGFYVYTFSQSGKIEPWHAALLRIGVSFFGVQPNGPLPSADGDDDENPTHERPATLPSIRSGFIPFDHDGSFDDWFHSQGVSMAAVSETPASKNLSARVACNASVLQETMNYVASAPVRVATRFMADLSPPLGDPGGPCQIIRRIDKTVRNPKLRDDLIEDVEQGAELSNPDAAKIYPLDTETGAGLASKLILTSHLQYRMDLRSVKVDDVRATLRVMTQALKSNPRAAQDLAHGEKVRYEDPRTRLVIVVQVAGRDTLRLITTFWKGRPDPKPVSAPSCGI
jgi:hypothetical protein